jgi:phosphatidylglycerophosphatase A
MSRAERIVIFLATGCYAGKLPMAPGTFGSLAALPLCWLLAQLGRPAAVMATVLVIAAAVWLAGAAERLLRQRDPGSIVIDEIAGMLVTFSGLPFTAFTATAGFVLFRVLDIAKPFPIGWVEKRLSGGSGIVMDDLIAGAMANLGCRLLLALLGGAAFAHG